MDYGRTERLRTLISYENRRRGGRGVIHCDATLWRTIELGVLDAGSDSDCCVDCCIGDGVVGKSGDGYGRGQPEAKTKIKKESVDWRVSFCELHILAHAVIACLATRRLNSTHLNKPPEPTSSS